MFTLSAVLTFHIPYASSLKQKRSVARSLIEKARREFNISIAEVDTQDVHQILTLGIAVVSGEGGHAKEVLDKTIRFMEDHADAELTHVEMVF